MSQPKGVPHVSLLVVVVASFVALVVVVVVVVVGELAAISLLHVAADWLHFPSKKCVV